MTSPTCADCGRPIKRHPGSRRWIHSPGGAVAACDLDSDHVPRPRSEHAADAESASTGGDQRGRPHGTMHRD